MLTSANYEARPALVKRTSGKLRKTLSVSTAVTVGQPLIDVVRYVKKNNIDLVIKRAEEAFR